MSSDELLINTASGNVDTCASYIQKIQDKDCEYFENFRVDEEESFIRELFDYIKLHPDVDYNVAESLILIYKNNYSSGPRRITCFGNSINRKLAEWLIYKDKEEYEYGDSDLDNAIELADLLDEEDIASGRWKENGSYWGIMSSALGNEEKKESFMYLLHGYNDPYPDYTTDETKLILSEMYYMHAIDLYEEEKEEAIRILTLSDIRLAKIKSIASDNHKAKEIHERLCRNTGIALYYLYSELGDNQKAIKELRRSFISSQEKTLCVFNSIEIPNPLYDSALPTEGDKTKQNGRSKESSTKKRKKSFLSKVKSTLKKMFK